MLPKYAWNTKIKVQAQKLPPGLAETKQKSQRISPKVLPEFAQNEKKCENIFLKPAQNLPETLRKVGKNCQIVHKIVYTFFLQIIKALLVVHLLFSFVTLPLPLLFQLALYPQTLYLTLWSVSSLNNPQNSEVKFMNI